MARGIDVPGSMAHCGLRPLCCHDYGNATFATCLRLMHSMNDQLTDIRLPHTRSVKKGHGSLRRECIGTGP